MEKMIHKEGPEAAMASGMRLGTIWDKAQRYERKIQKGWSQLEERRLRLAIFNTPEILYLKSVERKMPRLRDEFLRMPPTRRTSLTFCRYLKRHSAKKFFGFGGFVVWFRQTGNEATKVDWGIRVGDVRPEANESHGQNDCMITTFQDMLVQTEFIGECEREPISRNIPLYNVQKHVYHNPVYIIYTYDILTHI